MRPAHQVITSPRRYYLLMQRGSVESGVPQLRDVWKGKQLAEPGTPLPDGFPSKARLAAHGYVAIEDLLGADRSELEDLGFGKRDITAILAAVVP